MPRGGRTRTSRITGQAVGPRQQAFGKVELVVTLELPRLA
jgi:hypothetical protein